MSDFAPIPPQGGLAVSLTLDVRHCLVVGGGEAAAARVRSLLAAGAQVKVVSPNLVPELVHRAAWGEVAWAERAFATQDLHATSLVLVTLNDEGESLRIAALARARGILVNLAALPSECDFHLAA